MTYLFPHYSNLEPYHLYTSKKIVYTFQSLSHPSGYIFHYCRLYIPMYSQMDLRIH
nr:MAG TPA: hypothetical protein [Caudoviricetes sp.]